MRRRSTLNLDAHETGVLGIHMGGSLLQFDPMGIGITATGVFLPESIRENDYWPKELVDRWSGMFSMDEDTAPELKTDNQKRLFTVLKERVHDPFNGARARRVAAPGAKASDLEVAAARDALIESESVETIDGLICASAVPDNLLVTNAAKVHHELGLRKDCISFNLDSVANSFLHQVEVGRSLIETGRCRRVLLIQSSLMTRLADPLRPPGSWLGDGASALVLESVEEPHGILGMSHFTDGYYYPAVRATTDSNEWYSPGQVTWRMNDRDVSRELMLNVTEFASRAVSAALDEAEIARSEVSFFGIHQGTDWMQEECQRAVGLEHSKSMHNYPWTGLMGSAELPLMYHLAIEQELLREGEIGVFFSGGSGITYSALVIRAGGDVTRD